MGGGECQVVGHITQESFAQLFSQAESTFAGQFTDASYHTEPFHWTRTEGKVDEYVRTLKTDDATGFAWSKLASKDGHTVYVIPYATETGIARIYVEKAVQARNTRRRATTRSNYSLSLYVRVDLDTNTSQAVGSTFGWELSGRIVSQAGNARLPVWRDDSLMDTSYIALIESQGIGNLADKIEEFLKKKIEPRIEMRGNCSYVGFSLQRPIFTDDGRQMLRNYTHR